jgi:hypothetical protein
VADLPHPFVVVMRDVDRTYPATVHRKPGTWDNKKKDTGMYISISETEFAFVRMETDGSPAEQLAALADDLADWLVEQLPSIGHPAVWPPCPQHVNTHPLEAQVINDDAVWVCPRDETVVAAIGSLA